MTRFPWWPYPFLAAGLVFSWQWATVHANYGGNGTALFCTGGTQTQPRLTAEEQVYLFSNSAGYDGQFYHWIAHDPFLRSDLKRYVDDPALRYRRILIPLLAYSLALGNSAWIDTTYELVFVFTVALGVYWCCRFAQQAGLAAAWGMLFVLMPAVPISMDRLVVDAGLTALTAAFLCYSRSCSWKLLPVLAAAALARETGFLLIAAACVYQISKRHFRRAAVLGMSAVPALAWYTYVGKRLAAPSVPLSLVPLSAIARAALNPWKYPPEVPFPAAIRVADYLALAGMLLAFGLASVATFRKPSDPVRILAGLFVLMGIGVQFAGLWTNVYDFGRVYTPLLLCVAAAAADLRNLWLLVPLTAILPRVAIQLTPQLLGVIRWLV